MSFGRSDFSRAYLAIRGHGAIRLKQTWLGPPSIQAQSPYSIRCYKKSLFAAVFLILLNMGAGPTRSLEQ